MAHSSGVDGQLGHSYVVCKDGPVFHYPQVKPWLGREGV